MSLTALMEMGRSATWSLSGLSKRETGVDNPSALVAEMPGLCGQRLCDCVREGQTGRLWISLRRVHGDGREGKGRRGAREVSA